jgi:mannitol/fructose-specific phosphotransferase system IIA component (Ntr-type)
MVHSLFIPIFFVNIGLKIDFIANFDWLLVLITIIIGTFGRFSGAWIGVSFSKVPKVNRNLISIAHSAGGMMGIVVALIAVKANLILPKVFIAIVCSAVFSSIFVGPWMKYALNKRKNIKILQFLQTNSSLQILTETDKFTVLEKMVANLPFLLNQQDLAKILAGEREFSTGVGEGISIPHIRLESIKDPILLFGLSHNGIDWDSPDGKLVNFVFFLFSPATENDLHVELLANIVKVIQDKENQALILKSKNLTELSLVINKIFA